jgi:hypothetical protein
MTRDEFTREIESYIGGLEPDSIRFQFTQKQGRVHLDVITRNPRHMQEFLFHSTDGIDELDALDKMLDYVKTYKDKESSYTIQWSLVGESELQTSYFRARNIMHALDKLYFGRELNSVIVFSVKLNPIA